MAAVAPPGSGLALELLLEFQESLLLRQQAGAQAYYLPVLEIGAYAVVLNIVLEAPDVVGLHIRLCIITMLRDSCRLDHADQVGEAFLAAVVRGGRSEHQRFAARS